MIKYDGIKTYSLSMSDGRFLGTSSNPLREQSAEVWSQVHSHGHLALSVRSFRSSPRAPGPRATINEHRTTNALTSMSDVLDGPLTRACKSRKRISKKKIIKNEHRAHGRETDTDASLTLASRVLVGWHSAALRVNWRFALLSPSDCLEMFVGTG